MFVEFSPCQAGGARHRAAGVVRLARQAELWCSRPVSVEPPAQRVPVRVTGALDGVKAVAETAGGRQVAVRLRLGDIAAVDARLQSIRRASRSARTASLRSVSACVRPSGPIFWSSAGSVDKRPQRQRTVPAGFRDRADRRPAEGGGARRSGEFDALLRGGAGHRAVW